MKYNINDFRANRTDTEALQAMFDQAKEDNFRLRCFDLDYSEVKLEGTTEYEKKFGVKNFLQNGFITAPKWSDFDLINPDKGKGMKVSKGSAEDDIMKYIDRWSLLNLTFSGGRNQFRMVGSKQSSVRDCEFYSSRRGLDNIFGLQAVIENCLFQSNSLEGIRNTAGMNDVLLLEEEGVEPDEHDTQYFTNASGAVSACNMTVVKNCEVYAGNQIFGFRSQASDGILYEHCVAQGGAIPYYFYHDHRGSTTANEVTFDNIHIENIAQKYAIYARSNKLIEVNKYHNQKAGGQLKLIAPRVNVLNVKTIKLSPGCLAGSGEWFFNQQITNINEPTNWADDIERYFLEKGIESSGTEGIVVGNQKTGVKIQLVNYGTSKSKINMVAGNAGNEMDHDFEKVTDKKNKLKTVKIPIRHKRGHILAYVELYESTQKVIVDGTIVKPIFLKK